MKILAYICIAGMLASQPVLAMEAAQPVLEVEAAQPVLAMEASQPVLEVEAAQPVLVEVEAAQPVLAMEASPAGSSAQMQTKDVNMDSPAVTEAQPQLVASEVKREIPGGSGKQDSMPQASTATSTVPLMIQPVVKPLKTRVIEACRKKTPVALRKILPSFEESTRELYESCIKASVQSENLKTLGFAINEAKTNDVILRKKVDIFIYDQLDNALEKGYLESAKYLIKNFISRIGKLSNMLIWNSARYRLSALKLAITSIKHSINDKNRALLLAASGDLGENVSYLLSVGADPYYKDGEVFESAVRYSRINAVQAFIAFDPKNSTGRKLSDTTKTNALVLAIILGNVNVAHLLANNGMLLESTHTKAINTICSRDVYSKVLSSLIENDFDITVNNHQCMQSAINSSPYSKAILTILLDEYRLKLPNPIENPND